jgi:hypothetical protein
MPQSPQTGSNARDVPTIQQRQQERGGTVAQRGKGDRLHVGPAGSGVPSARIQTHSARTPTIGTNANRPTRSGPGVR